MSHYRLNELDHALFTYMSTLRTEGPSLPPELLKAFERRMNEDCPPIGLLLERHPVEGGHPLVTVDIVSPTATSPSPLLVWCHGGGWVSGSPRTHRRLACELAARGITVVNVDYRRAPEHRFPAALDDCWAAFVWAVSNADSIGGRAGGIFVGGDSAGANLAAVTLARAAREVPEAVHAGVLAYGIFDFHRALPIVAHVVGGTAADTQLYLPVEEFADLRGDPRVCPEVDAALLPPVALLAGRSDPLLGETLSLARALQARGRRDRLLLLEGAPHGILQLPFLTQHDAAHDFVASFIHGASGAAP